MSRRDAALEFDAILIEGGLLPAEWLANIATLKAAHQSPADYGIPKGLNLRDEVGRYWRIAQAHWSEFAKASDQAEDPHGLAGRFVQALMREVFGATDLQPHTAPVEISERLYPITVSAREGRLPLVIAAANQRLDERDRRYGDSGRQRSAFGLLQDYLNAADAALWGIASNGSLLRLARDNASLTRPAWIEADLARIFSEERYADFSLLWLLIHASRFGNLEALVAQCPLEAWREASKEQGTRARTRLRQGVEEALQALGQGFLSEAANQPLRSALASGALDRDAYFQQLLRLVYRLIFLLTIEERGLLHPADAEAEALKLYADGYSLRRLRERARRRRAFDRHADLWDGLKPVLAGLAHGQPLLALPALGGLFAEDQCLHLDASILGNAALLEAVARLGWMRDGRSLTRINWRDMGPEELGSVYESLLELVPDISADGRVFRFANAGESKGNARKTSGSYYTPDSLVQELLDSALEPVIAQRINGAAEPQAALLSITVCDPACGSGHFLLGAARRLATRLAQLRAQGTPSGEDFRHALRDVVTHCIFGVDRNPMAIELARMSLWLEAMTPDKPLGFLDHHLQCGDALLGITDLAALGQGVPKDAYKALSGDDAKVCRELAKRNTVELKDLARKRTAQSFGQRDLLGLRAGGLDKLRALEALPDATLEQIAVKQAAWQALAEESADSPLRHAADMLLAAFLLPKTTATQNSVPTTATVVLELLGDHVAPGHEGKRNASLEAAGEARVLHWPLAFPLVHAAGGFSCVLGNPPWEVSQLEEEEFFASRDALIASLPGDRRKKAIAELEKENPRLWRQFVEESQRVAASNTFYRAGRYPLTAVGKLNTYPLFAETISQLTSEKGRAGFIVPTGIATDDGNKAYFADVTQRGRLVSLYDIENREKLFPAVDSRMKFCLLTLGASEGAQFVCFATQVAQLHDPRRRFTLSPGEFHLINPNTLTFPVFRSERDAELTKKLYRASPVLIEEGQTDGNPWGIRFSQGLFNMTSDSHLFVGAPGEGRLPLYEAKLVHQFDHRWATYGSEGDSRDATLAEKADPDFVVAPRYWVDEREVYLKLASLPSGLLKALKEGNAQVIVLAVTHMLFGWWLADRRRNAADTPPVYPAWQAFVAEHPFAAGIAPTSLGLCGENPASLEPLNDDYLPAESESKVQCYQAGARDATAWYAVDPKAESVVMGTTAKYRDLPVPDGPLVDSCAVLALAEQWLQEACPGWLMGWRDITNATNERTVIASVVPLSGVGNQMPLMLFNQTGDRRLEAALLGNLCALVFDFVARHKTGGTHMNYFIYKQLPVLPPAHYSESDLAFIVPRVLELTYTAHDLASWACDLGFEGSPFVFDPDRRAILRAELDAYYVRLYGLTRDELRYILDPADVMGADYPSETFRVLKNNELREYGEYRTQHLVLREFDRMALAEANGEPYGSLLNPLPGQAPAPTYSSHGLLRDEVDARVVGLLLTMIRRHEGLSRRQLMDAIAIATQSNGPGGLVSAHDADVVAAYRNKHHGIFDTERLSGDRIQSWLRQYESVGVIRSDVQSARLMVARDSALPDEVMVDEDAKRIAEILLRAAEQVSTDAMEIGAEESADASVKRA